MDDIQACQEILQRIKDNVKKAFIGKDNVIDMILAAMICSGHVLIEDVPGLGKTTLVSAIARSVNCSFRRIQFTPDVLPSDVTGYTAFNMKTGERETVFGGVMAQIILADEINRTSPKTQSSLLEVMQEAQVTIDGISHPVPQPFIVLATQNPVEHVGTYPLPEAQMDRFLFKLAIGYPARAQELDILESNKSGRPLDDIVPVASAEDILRLRQSHGKVICAPPVMDYIVSIAEASRRSPRIALGISPRGSLALMRAAMARAMLQGRDYTLPDDVQFMALPVLAHRIVLKFEAIQERDTAEDQIGLILQATKVPGVS